MTISEADYEKKGAFYLGRPYKPGAEPSDQPLIYKSKDLVTHGVVLGMTGSGKTGLCIALLEEAALDQVPALIIDPKGDISNFLLTFPKLRGEDFRPWINEDDAQRKNQTPDEYADAQASIWKKGLADWGQQPERIQNLRDSVVTRIYTPGSDAGIPLSILSSLNAPSAAVLDNKELLSDRVVNTVSSILGLLGDNTDPQESKEHALMCAIFENVWKQNRNVDLQTLIRLILRPPFDKIGVFSVDEFVPRKDRDDLAKSLNNLIASPNFNSWLEGCPLDIPSLLYAEDGKPRVSVLSIAHLNDQERMFFVTLVLNELTAWMRVQSGTTSLRALFYMDEIFGYLPPIANPSSKRPMLLLLKQARAFGLGLLLATQNPVDLDYKALSNIGTWWLGRLQTQRDKDRVLDGLESAAGEQGGGFNRKELDQLLSDLGNRIFLQNNVNDDAPALMEVRWVMSYLRGPLARDQIKFLMDPYRDEVKMLKASDLTGGMIIPRPVAPNGVDEVFLPAAKGAQRYEPRLLRAATFIVASGDKRSQVQMAQLIPFTSTGELLMDRAVEFPYTPAAVIAAPDAEIPFDDLPKTLSRSFLTDAKSSFANEIYANHGVTIYSAEVKKLKMDSEPNETEADFRARLQPELDAIRKPLEDKLKQDHQAWVVEKWTPAYEKAKTASRQRLWTWAGKILKPLLTLLSLVVSILSKSKSGGGLGGTILREASGGGLSQAEKAARDIASASPGSARTGATTSQLENEREAREEKLAQDLKSLEEAYGADKVKINTETVRPYKKDVDVTRVALAWEAV